MHQKHTIRCPLDGFTCQNAAYAGYGDSYVRKKELIAQKAAFFSKFDLGTVKPVCSYVIVALASSNKAETF